jgi:hypothetical protein
MPSVVGEIATIPVYQSKAVAGNGLVGSGRLVDCDAEGDPIMHTVLRSACRIPHVFALGVALIALAPRGARADEANEVVGVPMPEQATPQEPAPEPEVPLTTPAALPGYVTSEGPIEAVHRPPGVWGPLAIAADVLVMRPLGFLGLAAGGAAFVIVSPVAAATQTLGSRVDALEERAKDVFTRPLGAL